MAGLEFIGDVPFRDVYVTGLVRDHLGRKMSKSLGNGIDPIEVVGKFGADALRYTVMAGAAAGTDQRLNYQDQETTFAPGRNFANKLWNAGRFAVINLGDGPRVPLETVSAQLELADRWVLSRLAQAITETTDHLERFRLNDAIGTAYAFFWGDLADWYLEASKPRLYGDMGDASRDAARATLAEVLDSVLRLLHPFMPFITETVWDRLPRSATGGAPESLVIAGWPVPHPEWADPAAERQFEGLRDAIGAVRNIRTEYKIPPAQRVHLQVGDAPPELREALASEGRMLYDLARVEAVGFGRGDGEIGASAVLRSGAELFIPLAGVLDLDRERARLRGELEHIANLLRGTEAKLGNQGFVARAPANVVERERTKLASYQEQHDKLAAKLTALAGSA
jgi:valyl-tRNA synthetase